MEGRITTIYSEINVANISQHISSLNVTDGSFSQIGLWKMKSKICPRPRDPPMAKRDLKGNLVSAAGPLKQLYIETYSHRLRHREMRVKYEEIFQLKTKLWNMRLEELKLKSSLPWESKIYNIY